MDTAVAQLIVALIFTAISVIVVLILITMNISRNGSLQVEVDDDTTMLPQETFDDLVVDYQTGDEIITIEAKEINDNEVNPTAHYRGELLGINHETQKLTVILDGMHETDCIELPMSQVLSNETLRERQERPSYKHRIELTNYY